MQAFDMLAVVRCDRRCRWNSTKQKMDLLFAVREAAGERAPRSEWTAAGGAAQG